MPQYSQCIPCPQAPHLRPGIDDIDFMQRDGVHDFFAFLQLPLGALHEPAVRTDKEDMSQGMPIITGAGGPTNPLTACLWADRHTTETGCTAHGMRGGDPCSRPIWWVGAGRSAATCWR